MPLGRNCLVDTDWWNPFRGSEKFSPGLFLTCCCIERPIGTLGCLLGENFLFCVCAVGRKIKEGAEWNVIISLVENLGELCCIRTELIMAFYLSFYCHPGKKTENK